MAGPKACAALVSTGPPSCPPACIPQEFQNHSARPPAPPTQSYLPPALHRVPGPSSGTVAPHHPRKTCSLCTMGMSGASLPPFPPTSLPLRIPNRMDLWSDSAYRPCSHWAGAGASSGEEPGGQGDSWGGCRAVATAMEPVCAHRDSCQRGWRLLYIVAAYHSCSEVLQPHLTHFLQDVSRTPGLPFQGEGQASGDPGPGAHHTRTGWAASRRA